MTTILIYLGAGAIAGFIAGLFGVGGGMVIVPVLASIFTAQALAPEYTMQIAIGTSLATIVATALSSIIAHHRRGNVDWTIFKRMLPGIIAGTWLGAAIADISPTENLRVAFGIAEIALGLWMFRGAKTEPVGNLPGAAGMLTAGSVIGALSALAGIGGGTFTVPFLVRCRVAMVQAIGTSSACGLPIALSGTLSYIVWGWNDTAAVSWASGYVYWPAAAGIVAASILFAPVGARLAHKLPAHTMKRIFAGLLVLLGLKLLLA